MLEKQHNEEGRKHKSTTSKHTCLKKTEQEQEEE